jgi:type VI secretion system protein ImpG
MFNKYYQDELSFLRQMGREFSQAYPELAHMLAEKGSDPDVERLLEGFAFLTGRIRQKLDDELPELTHGMMELVCPHYLRPVPSMAILKFEPLVKAVTETKYIPRGIQVDSQPVDGTRCTFQTCYDVNMHPLEVEDAFLEIPSANSSILRVSFKVFDGAQLQGISKLRFHLHGDPVLTHTLYLFLCNYLKQITVKILDETKVGRNFLLKASAVRPVGFSQDESLLPYPWNSHQGYRILQEYFSFPAKFLFFDLIDLEPLNEVEITEGFEVIFEFDQAPQVSLQVSRENILLFCTPIVNLFQHEADPIRIEHESVEYLIRPSGQNPLHYEIYSIDKVAGYLKGTLQRKEYSSFFSFEHSLSPTGEDNVYYQTHIKPSVVGDGVDTYISFVNADGERLLPEVETVSLSLTCSNRRLPEKLRVGDICLPTHTSPEFAHFRNITNPSVSVMPPLGGRLYWRLISHLSLNYLSLRSPDVLKEVLKLYNFHAMYDRQAARSSELLLSSIKKLETRPLTLLFNGAPIRGLSIDLELLEENFASEGHLYLFAMVLNEFFGLFSSINSFTKLTVKGVKYGEVYHWPPKIGQQNIL